MEKSTHHHIMQTKEEVSTSTNKEVTSEAENDITLQKDLRVNATSGVSQNLAGFVTQYTELKDQLKLSKSVEDPGLALRTTDKVKTECISARLLDEPGANISKLDPSKKRRFEKISDPGYKALNPKKKKNLDGKPLNWKLYYNSMNNDYEEYARVLAADRRSSTLSTLKEYKIDFSESIGRKRKLRWKDGILQWSCGTQ
ncbi:hypothetical protein QYM36_019814 [Artemia franciscana]|uniref:Uncharacterized protein n=1 Tax=Artemia franciscana TaxID=6661 RepID=A0AA88H4P6_ARTSF|nr:hypothetical protein QYM36_019814 [Artemia franciscana]